MESEFACQRCRVEFVDSSGSGRPYYRIQRPYQLGQPEIIYLCRYCYENKQPETANKLYAANQRILELEAEIKKRDIEKYTQLLRRLLEPLDPCEPDKGLLMDYISTDLRKELRRWLRA